MELPATTSQPTGAERAARSSVIIFLVLASLVLVFGLGFGLSELRADNKTTTGAAPAAAARTSNGQTVGAATIDEIAAILQQQYVDRKNLVPDDLKDAAIRGMISSLNDRETNYIAPEELKAGALQLNSTYQGIGASVDDRSGTVRIVAPFRDSPAEKAGIKTGDEILEVDGEKTDGWSAQVAVQKIRGPKGTTVQLKVKHTDGTIETIAVQRGEIDIESVFVEPKLETIPGESGKKIVDRTGAEAKDICYLAIAQFHEKTPGEVRTKAKGFEASGCKGLVLDLRGNPGGGLQATIDVADEFLNSGTIIVEQDANGQRSSTAAKNGGILTKLKVAILQDQGSASGAEVLAAALRDNGHATIIGARSYGKGTVNRLIPLQSCGVKDQCGALYLAIGRWLTPKGELIEGVGITPDTELPMTSKQYIDEGDIQIFKAIDYLRGLK